MLADLTFRKPGPPASVYECANPKPSRRLTALERLLLAAVVLVIVGLLVSVAARSQAVRDHPAGWWIVAGLGALVIAAFGLVAAVGEWTKKRTFEWLDRNTLVWLDDRGFGVWVGFFGRRIPYEKVERVARIAPPDAPRGWRLLFDREDFVGVRIDGRGGALSGGRWYLFVERAEAFIEELERRAAARGVGTIDFRRSP